MNSRNWCREGKKRMWISKERWQGMEMRMRYLEGILAEREMRIGFFENTFYADNEISHKEFRICISGRDWSKLRKKQFWKELIQYGRDLNRRTQDSAGQTGRKDE